MSNLPRILIIYAIAIPLALILGYSMSDFGSDPDLLSIGFVGLVLFVLALPIILHSYMPILLFCWNATLIAFFLPGAPSLFLVVAFASFALLVVQRGMRSGGGYFSSPTGLPLFILAIVILITAGARGFGLHSLGFSSSNGKKYVELLAAIVAYFVLSNEQIPRKRAILYVSLFFVGGVTAGISDLIYIAGSKFYWMYNLISSASATTLATSSAIQSLGVFRIEGTAAAGVAFSSFMLARYGIKGLLDPRRPWRLLLFVLAVVATAFGGYRARFLLVAFFLFFQFFLEGLWRTWLMPVVLAAGLVMGGVLYVAANRLPNAVQRSISFLPIEVDPEVKVDAEATVEWRKGMWAELESQIPTYFFLGRGYGFSDSEYFIVSQMADSYLLPSYEPFILSGEYHSGPYSVMIPLGIFGVLAFLWFLIAGGRVIWRNYRRGEPELKRLNTFLMAFFLARVVIFFSVFGALEIDLAAFTGAVGLSIALNRKPPKPKQEKRFEHEGASIAAGSRRALFPAEM